MKSRFMFTLLLFSLFFNISHDLFINTQTVTCDSEAHASLFIEEADKDLCCSEMIDLHEHFHFSAILYDVNVDFFHLVKTTLTFVNPISFTSISQSTFRPPIA